MDGSMPSKFNRIKFHFNIPTDCITEFWINHWIGKNLCKATRLFDAPTGRLSWTSNAILDYVQPSDTKLDVESNI